MKAILATNYGSPDVLHMVEVEKPAAEDDRVLVKESGINHFHPAPLPGVSSPPGSSLYHARC